ncbi:MAG: protein translocase subunit SecD [Acidobacteriota bacterium]
MKRNLNYRLILIVLVLVISIYLSYPPSEKINLGLDLKGGIHLVLQVNTEDAFEVETSQKRETFEADLKAEGIVFTRTQVTEDFGIDIIGALPDQEDKLEVYLNQYAPAWTYRSRDREGELDMRVVMSSAERKALADRTVRDARETIQKRVDQYGVAEPTIQIYGSGDVQDQIIVELPGVEDFDRVLNLIKSTAMLELKVVHPTEGGPFVTREAAAQNFDNRLPADYEIIPYPNSSPGQTTYLVVRKAPSLTGKNLKTANRAQDDFTGRSEVAFFLDSEGVRLFTRTTEQNVGNRLAVVLDDQVYSAPRIDERIASESARITGNFSPEEAEDLALVLRSGALPASIQILENRIIGPSLGLDSIRRGVLASLVGLILVIVGMLVVYKLSGINAIVCLGLNLVILMAVLSGVHATLTLPGIAGIILTIGMAVDANILIFERIKEELRLGKTVRSAVDAGFERVFTTILDTNVTTLIGALVLYQVGTGPVRGFAVTLGVGLVANIFSAVFVSRTFFALALQRLKVERLSI